MAEAPESPRDPRAMMSTPPDYSLVPFGPDYATVVLPLVPELRQRVAATLPPGTKLWGGDLLNPDDAAGTHLLAKFLRARDLNLDKAQAMLENTLEWRKTYGTDAIATDTSIPDCLATVAVLSGHARSGHQIIWFEYGTLSTQPAWDAAFHHGKVADGPLIRQRVKILEQGISNFDLSKGMDAPNGFVLVHDMREAPLGSLLVSSDASSGMIQMVKVANENFPDMSIKHVFLYAPTLLSAVLVMLKPFLSSRTQRKLLWAPHGSELLTLLQLMPLSSIPARHGGFAGLGPPAGEVTDVDVPAGREQTVTLRTMAEGNEAHWLVSVMDHSIELRAEFVPLGGGAVQQLGSRMVTVGDTTVANCSGAVEGSFVATQAGNVRLSFDNVSSWMTPKRVLYAAGVRLVAAGSGGPTLFSSIAGEQAAAAAE